MFFAIQAAEASSRDIGSRAFLLAVKLNAELEAGSFRLFVDGHDIAVFDFAFENQSAQRRLQFFLDQPFERPGAIIGIVAGHRKMIAAQPRSAAE